MGPELRGGTPQLLQSPVLAADTELSLVPGAAGGTTGRQLSRAGSVPFPSKHVWEMHGGNKHLKIKHKMGQACLQQLKNC